jgi:hypothetical protein
MTKPAILSTTARTVLTAAAARGDDRAALPPERLPAAAQRAVVASLLKTGLLEEIAAEDDQAAWRTTEHGSRFALRITDAGLNAIGAGADQNPSATAQREPPVAETASAAPHAPVPPEAGEGARVAPQRADARLTLRAAAFAVMVAWDEEGRPALPNAIAALRAALTTTPSARAPTGSRPPRTDTKQAAVLALLRRPEGASGPQMIEATGWAPHTVRGFLAGLAKKDITVAVLDRVRQVGPGKEGAKGSYTVYRIAEAG